MPKPPSPARAAARAVPCPKCGAPAGRRCVTTRGGSFSRGSGPQPIDQAHKSRQDAAEQARQ